MTQTEPLDASVTLEEIITVVTQKRAPLAPELAGYLVLELAENIGKAAADIDPRSVYVSEEGSVALVRAPNEPGGDAELPLRTLLAKLLEAANAQTPALAVVSKRKSSGEGVAGLVEEIEAALVPVNRSAGKRALARLARETKRVTARVGRNKSHSQPGDLQLGPPADDKAPAPADVSNLPTVGISKEDLDAAASKAKRDSVDSLLDSFEASGKMGDKALSRELKAMAGLEPTPPPPSAPDDADLEALLAEKSVPSVRPELTKDTGRETPVSRRSSPPPVRDRAPSYADQRQATTAPSRVRKLETSLSDIKVKPHKKGSSNITLILLVVVLFGLFAAVLWKMGPGFLTGRTPDVIAKERAAAEAESARIAAQRAEPTCHTSLVVTGAPKDAEILVREGQAPLDVDHMPMGTRLELVATAEGYTPKRGIIEADTPWDTSGSKPHIDLPIQLDKSHAHAGAVDPWPPGEPDTNAGGNGKPGTVHVITSPKGAEVWLLAGLGQEMKRGEPPPEVVLEDVVGCDADVDVMVAGPTTYRKRLHVPASSFVAGPDPAAKVRVAHLAVK